MHSDGYMRLYLRSAMGEIINPKKRSARFTLNYDSKEPVNGKFLAARGGAYFWRKVDVIRAELIKIRVEIEHQGAWIPMDFHVSFASDV